MKCQNCGKELNDDFQLCPYCGSAVESADNRQTEQTDTSTFGNTYNYGTQKQTTQYQPNSQNQKKNGVIGVLALVFGIIGMLSSCAVVGILPAIIGVIFGIIGIATKSRKGMSIAGLVCGCIGVFIFVIAFSLMGDSDSSNSSNVEESTQIVSEIESESENGIDTKNDSKDDSKSESTEKKKDKDDKKESSKPKKEKSEKAIRKEFIDSCEELNYKKIARNPDDYIGKNFKVNVQISSISEETWLTDSYMKAYTDDGSGYYFDKMIYIFDDQDENSSYYLKVLEDDVITVYGTFEGMEDTKNYLNGETSKDIALHMKYAKLISE